MMNFAAHMHREIARAMAIPFPKMVVLDPPYMLKADEQMRRLRLDAMFPPKVIWPELPVMTIIDEASAVPRPIWRRLKREQRQRLAPRPSRGWRRHVRKAKALGLVHRIGANDPRNWRNKTPAEIQDDIRTMLERLARP